MNPTAFTIAIAQCASRVGEVDANLDVAARLCAQASTRRADLILFPECHATGCSYRDTGSLVRRTAQPADGRIGLRLRSLAKQFSMAVCCGTFERCAGKIYNTQLVAFPDGRLEGQRKGAPSPPEKSVIACQAKRQCFEWNGVRFAILICHDLTLPDFRKQLDKLKIDLLLHPSAGKICGTASEERLLAQSALERGQALACKLGVAYAVANPIGFSGEDYYPGNSWLINSQGRIRVRLPATTALGQMKDAVGIARLS